MKSNNNIESIFLTETAKRINRSFSRINHCLDQLCDEDLTWRPNFRMNSITNLVLHIEGNLRQWILYGLGEQEDLRDRSKEFENNQPMSKQMLKLRLSNLKAELLKCLENCEPNKLQQSKEIQGLNMTLLNAVYSTMTHLEGHTGQITYITRWKIGEKYKFF